MANVVNKTNPSEYFLSVNTPDYDPAQWLINPPGLAILLSVGVPPRYWKLNQAGDDVIDMEQPERDAVDAQIAADQVLQERSGAKDSLQGSQPMPRVLIAIVTELMILINDLRSRVSPPQPAITKAQFIQLIKDRIDAE